MDRTTIRKSAGGLQVFQWQQILRSLLWLLIVTLIPCSMTFAAEEGDDHHSSTTSASNSASDDHGGDEVEPFHAVLFPAFALTIGVLVFYVLTRYIHVIPYTAVMFIIGTLMGVGAALTERSNQLQESILMWVQIDSEVLLLVFLPGLIFKDAIGLNVHLFRVALLQCIIFAFPMVLAGTSLTALVAYFILPFEEKNFNLAMTFGSILSATDPVAVAALLEEVGAPPRLKVHIGGEALLNDGAAIVFFAIFAERYFYDIGIPDNENIDVGRGVEIFFRKSLGGVAIGIFFGLGLLFILHMLKRRFNREENIVEATATMAIAYVGYYVAEPVWEASGVISTLTTGVIVKFLGSPIVNDPKLLDDFWRLVEHLLNIVLFTLGGTVWGEVIANGTSHRGDFFTGKDWGYLFLLYVLLHVIRFILFAGAFPITKRIGMKTNIKETVFQVYGGLRGAVGIALALALDNEVIHIFGKDSVHSEQTSRLFGYVGGFAFFTLVINGSTAGPILRRMGLADSTEAREKIVHAYQVRFRASTIDNMVRLLAQQRFRHVDFGLVTYHVPILADLKRAELIEAVEKNKETTASDEYKAPYLKRVLPCLKEEEEQYVVSGVIQSDTLTPLDLDAQERKVKHELRRKKRKKRRTKSTMRFFIDEKEPMSAQELRLLFISILKSAYEKQIREGELEDRQFLAVALNQSLDFAADAVSNGEPLRDWDYVNVVDLPIMNVAKRAKDSRVAKRCFDCVTVLWRKKMQGELTFALDQAKIERSLAFMAAHRWAQKFFRREFEDAESELSESGKVVINESQAQYEKAEAALKDCDPKDVEVVASHKFCRILLNSNVFYVGELVKSGRLKEEEAEHLVEHIEENLNKVKLCKLYDHPGEISIEEDGDGAKGRDGRRGYAGSVASDDV